MTMYDVFNRNESQDCDSTPSAAVLFGSFSDSSAYDCVRNALGVPSDFPVLSGAFDDGLDASGPASFSTRLCDLLSTPSLLLTVQVGLARFTWLMDPRDLDAWRALDLWQTAGRIVVVLVAMNGAVRAFGTQVSLRDQLASLKPREPVGAVDHQSLYGKALALSASRSRAWEMVRRTELAASWPSERFCVITPSRPVDAMTDEPEAPDEHPPPRQRVSRLLRPSTNPRVAERQLLSLSPDDFAGIARRRCSSRATALSTIRRSRVRQ